MNDAKARKRIGIFGGSFDPIHIGHLMIACLLQEEHNLDMVYFVPAHANPLKQQAMASSQHRLHMIKLALRGTGFRVLTCELDRPPPSYMIDTVKELIHKKKASYFLLMGDDLLEDITHWKSYRELLQLAPPLIASRSEHIPIGSWKNESVVRDLIHKGITKTPLCTISSTYIRSRLEKGLFCGHLLDHRVYRYIMRNKLYGT